MWIAGKFVNNPTVQIFIKMGERGVKRQYLATLVINLYMLGVGIFQGWSELQSVDYGYEFLLLSPIILFTIGGFIGTIILNPFGFNAMKYGRKIPLFSIFISTIVSV